MSEPWFKDGLRFTCTRCGKCCTGPPGFVWVNDEEVAAIAEYIGESVKHTLALVGHLYDPDEGSFSARLWSGRHKWLLG